MCGCVVGGWAGDVTNDVGGVGGGAINSWGVASSLQRPPVHRRGEAVVGGVVREVSGVRKSRVRGGGQVGGWGRSFIWQVKHGGRRERLLIWVQKSRAGGGAMRGGAG